MTLIFTRHSLRQLLNRTALSADELINYFSFGAAVQSREERNGNKEWVIFSPKNKECFALIVARGGQLITIMPIVWRKISPVFIQQARELYAQKMEAEGL